MIFLSIPILIPMKNASIFIPADVVERELGEEDHGHHGVLVLM